VSFKYSSYKVMNRKFKIQSFNLQMKYYPLDLTYVTLNMIRNTEYITKLFKLLE